MIEKVAKKFGGMKNTIYLCSRALRRSICCGIVVIDDNASLAQLARARDL